ncbi:hypothetical protein LMG27952_06720 [Paraburkholderia hiiakae]|uniref:Uncharacterized protein n=1 Tax=Paraburkholderia hiiakae TaxID=1081782 RepID=A0ABM8P834_9BURK|nr:hypothetical protein [Paraburkholderia hiiakae]CAD6558818.1 hypothetical protein LMG27952_06720 [Paraburkholderia hiiakae]
MRTHYDPFADCVQTTRSAEDRLRRNHLRILWVEVAIELVMCLVDAYDSLKQGGGGDDTSAALGSISTQLGNIVEKLDEVKAELSEIFDLLTRLPELIRGVLKEDESNELIGELSTLVLVVEGYTGSPDRLYTHKDEVVSLLDAMIVKVGGLTGIWGMSGLLVASPYLGSYLSGRVAYEKVMKSRDPGYQIYSPWSEPVIKDAKQKLIGLFADVEKQDYENEQQNIPNFPPHMRPLVLDGPYLRPTPWGAGDGTYRLTCPSAAPERLQQWSAFPPGSPDGQWLDVPDDPDNRVVGVWKGVVSSRDEVKTFYDTVPQVYVAKANLLSTFDEPPNFW